MICESKMLNGFETRGVKKGWEIIYNTQEKFCNNIKRISRGTAKLHTWGIFQVN